MVFLRYHGCSRGADLIFFEPKERIARWVFARIKDEQDNDAFFALPYQAMGFTNAGGVMAGGVVYHTYRGETIEAIAAGIPGWQTPQRVRAMFKYAFDGLKVNVIVTQTAKGNRRARYYNERLGFKLRGAIPKAYKGKTIMIYSMSRDECRWLR